MKLTITLKDGRKAWTERGDWSSTDPGFATYCTIFTSREAASYLPHPFLESAKRLAAELGGTLEIEGAVNSGKPGDIH